jgi:hypothetical protein
LEVTGLAIFCALALSVTTMPVSNDIAMPRAVSHRQPNRVRTLFSLVIRKLRETVLYLQLPAHVAPAPFLINNGRATVELSFFGLFLQISCERSRSCEVSLEGQSVRMTEGLVKARAESRGSLKEFLENSGHCLFSWLSRKKDRLEQRQAAGKTPWLLFHL